MGKTYNLSGVENWLDDIKILLGEEKDAAAIKFCIAFTLQYMDCSKEVRIGEMTADDLLNQMNGMIKAYCMK